MQTTVNVTDYIPMVRRIVYKNFRRYCNCQDDIDILISEGTLYLIDLLNRKNENDHFEAFIGSGIKGRLKNYVSKWNRERKTVKVEESIHKYEKRSFTQTHKSWLLDEIEKRIKESDTKRILRLLRQGYTEKEIINLLQLSDRTSVSGYIYKLKYKAVRIMKERSMGIIDSQWMFGCPDFD
jgi:hypothetical protein